MYAVYLCGATDCFLSAIFKSSSDAWDWANTKSSNPEGYVIKYWETTEDIDTSNTGWEK